MQKSAEVLFVYGTLREPFLNKAAVFLKENATHLGNAYTFGKLFEVDSYPGMILSQDCGDKVWGDHYLIDSQSSHVWQYLDEYEGYSPSSSHDSEYLRLQIATFDSTNISHDSWCYLYNRDVSLLTCISSGDYVTHFKYSIQRD